MIGSIVALLGLVSAASAQEVGDYLNLSFSGDGESPTALERFSDAAGRTSPAVGGAGSVSSTGDATYGIPVALPPARLSPSVALSYSSAGSYGPVGRGWSLDVGLTVRRPTGSEASLYDPADEVHLVSGDGFSGATFPRSNDVWVWASDTPGDVVVDYSPGSRVFTITRDDTTWTLEPRADVTWGNGLEPTEWHVVRKEDTSGNRVDWTWGPNGFGDQIASISYGGTTSVAHFLRVTFEWGSSPYQLWRASDGVVSDLSRRLDAVVVESAYGHAYEARRVYHLDYDAVDELLLGVTEDDGSGPERDVASFEYASFVASHESSTEVPTSLGYQSSFTGTRATGATTSDIVFADSSGDGLPDVATRYRSGRMRQEPGSGVLIRPLFEPVDREWEDPSDENASHALDTLGYFDKSVTVALEAQPLGAEPEDLVRGTYATIRFVDLDGDGFQDRVSTGVVPVDWTGSVTAREDNEALAPSTWHVDYGEADSWDTGPVSEAAPVPFPRAFSRPDLPEMLGAAIYDHPPFDFEDATIDLADIDGDGWQDVVRVAQGTMSWFRKIPARGQGWEATGRPVDFDTLSGATFQPASLQKSKGYVESADDSESYDATTLSLGVLQVPKIEFMEAITGLRDLNGDGVVDFVWTGSWSASDRAWNVWRGTGDGFEEDATRWPSEVPWLTRTDEGNPLGRVCSVGADVQEFDLIREQLPEIEEGGAVSGPSHPGVPNGCTTSITVGTRPSAVVGGLLDLDGDGRQDLVDGGAGVWYRNQGDGFSQGGTPLPAWMPTAYVGNDGVSSHVLGVTRTKSMVTVSADQPQDPAQVIANPNSSVSETLVHVGDVDHDGLPDVIDLRETVLEVRYSGRTDGQAERPGLLLRVVEGPGAEIDFYYRSSATLPEIGQDGDYYAPQRKDLVGRMDLTDPVSGWSGYRRFDQWDQVQVRGESGGAGKFAGFGLTSTEDWEVERYGLFDLPAPFLVQDTFLGRSSTTWSVDRDRMVPEVGHVSTDANASWVPGRDPGDEDVRLRQRTDWVYQPDPNDWPVGRRWLASVSVDDHLEDRVDAVADAYRTSTVEYTYDAVGNVETQVHSSPTAPDDRVEVHVTWEHVGAMWRPLTIETWSIEPLTGALALVESGTLDHDALGRLETQTVCVSATCATDPLEWTFDRTDRGAVSGIHGPLGRDTLRTGWAFGDTVAGTETRELGHVSQQVPDDLGRVETTTDPNGVVRTTTSDAYGRPVQTTVRGAGSATTFVLSETLWYDDVVPRYAETTTHHHAADGSPLPSSTSYEVFDGFGRSIQAWAPAPDGGWVVTETERDVRGVVRRVSQPHVEDTFDTDLTTTRGPENATWVFVDYFGDDILRWSADAATWDVGGVAAPADVGLTWVDRPAPGEVRTRQGGYERREKHDTLGRLLQVFEGTTGATVRTGGYRYDGRDRVVWFTDGNDASWAYSMDLAGRVLQVRRKPSPMGAWEDYVGFEWTGPDPRAMWEGAVGTGTKVAEWTYDDLGRTTHKWTTDPLAVGGSVTTRWWWDRPPAPLTGPEWLGVRHATKDLSGGVQYRYDPDVVFGGLGHVTRTTRAWNDLSTATFERSFDVEGRLLEETWPSGRTVTSSWLPSGHLAGQTVTDPAATFTSTVSYDPWYGVPDGFEVTGDSGGHTVRFAQEVSRTTASQIDDLDWEVQVDAQAPVDRFVHYGWGDGLLRSKLHTGDEFPSTYGYDGLQRINGIYRGNVYDGGLVEFVDEVRNYDVVGHPQMVEYASKPRFTYDAPTAFNEIGRRREWNDLGLAGTELMSYDDQSRLVAIVHTTSGSKSRTFKYDGAGRLRRVQSTAGNVSYAYDVDDAIAEETRPGSVRIRRFGGWRQELRNGATTVTEQVLPMVRLEGSNAVFAHNEPDGHAAYTTTWPLGSAGTTTDADVVGAYGADLGAPGKAVDWALDGFHGAEADLGGELVHFGARHMLVRDGLWLQPEPLLYLGLTNGDLAQPRSFGPLYALGNSNSFMDPSGYIPITEKGLRDNPSPETLEPSSELVAGMKSLEAGTAARQNDPQDPGFVATGRKPENSQELVIPTGGGEAGLVGPVDTTGVSGSTPPGGGNNAHGHGFGTVVGPSTNSNPAFAGRPNDESTAIAVAATSSQGIGLVAVANGPMDGSTRTIGAVTAVRTSGGIVVSHYAGRVNQADNAVVLVRVGTPQTVPLPSAP